MDPCHQLMDWEDPLEDRPVVFKIREYSNLDDNSCTVSKPLIGVTNAIYSITTLRFARINTRHIAAGALAAGTPSSDTSIMS
jgi:hypothetical protein